ncbi:MAG: hypothetical protein GY847_38850 [Proteobacteria bacterium]|nr:hypothetical protein [Pseudomonadota bacterium]
MKRLLIRLVAFVIILSLPLIWEIEFALQWPFNIRELFERVGSGGCSIVVKQLSEARGARRERLRKQYEDDFGFPITIYKDEPIPRSAAERMVDGRQIAHYWNENYEDYLAAPLEGRKEWVSFGPIFEARYVGYIKRFMVYGPILIIYALATWLLIWPIVRQHRRLEHAATKIAAYDWKSRVKTKYVPDMKPLARAFNQMANKTERVIASQRMLLKSVSHELRTPIARLRFGLELFMEKDDRDSRQKHIENLEIDVIEMDSLIDELLTYARFEDQNSPVSRTTLVVPDVLQLISNSELAVRKTRIALEQTERLSKMFEVVYLDAEAFKRAIANLIRNAINHAKSKVLLDAWIVDNTLNVTVDDDGAGISEEMREKVFEPFVKLSDQSGGASKGTGLGLAIVKQAVEQHVGDISVSSSPLGGSRFETRWPLE